MADKNDSYQPPQQGPPPPYNQYPPAGFQPPTHVVYPHPQSSHSSTTIVTTQPTIAGQPIIAAQPMVIMAGGNCPACRSGILQNEFTCCGICLGICFFPLGLLCCYVMRERRCSNCHASFGSP